MKARRIILPIIPIIGIIFSLNSAAAQSIVRMNLAHDICASTPTIVTIGYNQANTAVIFTPQATLGHSERIFLPDGQPCEPYGCSYRSPVTFNAFEQGATISSVNDIKYVRLNMEHSYIGDIYIGITCPDGRRASLMNWKATGSSNCTGEVPQNCRGWSGSCVSGATYLGNAYDYTGSPACDSSVANNQPGIGWNYCWSENNNSNYQYAQGGTVIYRYGNATNGRIDSSNVAAGTNFFRPDHSFTNLIGCPLNGDWYIEVIDAYSGDNGYIFEWELSLDAALVPIQCEVTSRQLIGPYTQRIDDSTFRIDWPAITHDTIINYTFRLVSSCGTTFDTTVAVNLHPSYETTQEIIGCNYVTYNNHTYTTSTTLTHLLTSQYGCDSTDHVNIVVQNTLYTNVYDTAVENSLPYIWHNYTIDTTGTRTVTLTSRSGCDSIVTLYLKVWPNVSASVDTTICESTLPFTWNGITFTTADILTATLTDMHGADSLLTMNLHVIATQYQSVSENIVENDLPHPFCGVDFVQPVADTSFNLVGIQGCDSIVTYNLSIWWNKETMLDTTLCSNQLPLIWHGHTFSAASTIIDNLLTSHNADSTVFLTLHVNPTYDLSFPVSICNNQSQPFEDTVYSDAGSYPHLLTTSAGCDSLRTLVLSLRDTTTHTDTVDVCDSYIWHDTTYTISAIDTFFVGTNAALCDSTDYLHLTVRHSTASSYYDTVIENLLPRLFNGQSFITDIQNTPVVITNAAGCDSTIDYSLHVHWNVDTTLYDTLCNSSLPYPWSHSYGSSAQTATFDTTVAASAVMTRTVTILAHTGADSVITMYLTVHPLFDYHTTATICDSLWVTSQNHWTELTYSFGDSIYHGTDGTTVHTDSLHSIHGCDSLSTLHLTVNPSYEHHLTDTVCTNMAYTWGTPQRTMVTPYIIATQQTAACDTSFLDCLHTVHNCDSLSYLHLLLVAAYDYHHSDTICDAHIITILPDSSAQWNQHSYIFESDTFNTTGIYPFHLYTQNTSLPACDSLRTLHLKVYPTYDQHLYDTIYDGDTYLFGGITYDTTGVYPHLLQAVYACDSLRTLHLQRNWRSYNDSTLCQNALPLTWNGIIFAESTAAIRNDNVRHMADSVHLTGRASTDSLVVMRLHVVDTSAHTEVLHSCDSLAWQDGITYCASADTPFVTLTNAANCDSVVHLVLTVDYTHYYTDSLHACDSLRWIDNRWYYRDTTGIAGPVGSRNAIGPVDTLVTTVGQCDSVVSLKLAMHYSVSVADADTFCYNQTYSWQHFNLSGDDSNLTQEYYLTDTLPTVWQCDSIVGLHVTKMARPHISFDYEIICRILSYDITVNTDVNYIVWSSLDPSLDGQELMRNITVSPQQTQTYYLYADYHETPLCPLTHSIVLPPITIPEAKLRVNPNRLSFTNLEYNAYDMSGESERREWFVDSVRQAETAAIFSSTADADKDTFEVALSIFNGQCWDTTSQLVTIRKVAIYAPNAFTPNNSDNNRFTLVTQGVMEGELRIYNRDGILVFTTRDFAEQGWDGSGAPQGNYVWQFTYRAIEYPDTWQNETGSILLIR